MNLWIYGIDHVDADEDTWAVVCEFGKQVLKLDQEFLNGLMFKNVHRVGSTKSTNRPIIVAFLMAKDRMKFLKSASTLYNYNKKHNTKYGVETDLAPKARAERNRLNYAANNWRRATGKILMVRNNDKGKVWMVTKPNHESAWRPVGYVDPKWFMDPNTPPVSTGNPPLGSMSETAPASTGSMPPVSIDQTSQAEGETLQVSQSQNGAGAVSLTPLRENSLSDAEELSQAAMEELSSDVMDEPTQNDSGDEE